MTARLAMVTGASSGIGEAFARELAKRGFKLILVARRRDRLTALQTELAAVDVDLLPADLTAEEGVSAVSRRLEMGGISLLVNNAGAGYSGSVHAQADRNIAHLVRLNLEAPLRLARAALGPMVAAGGGDIINVASMGAFQPVPYLSVYAATKAGLLSFSEALADEVKDAGIRIQTLCPGNIPTGFQDLAGTRGSRLDRTPSMSPAAVVASSLDALSMSGLHIPGHVDRASVFAQRFLPRWVARRVAGNLMRHD